MNITVEVEGHRNNPFFGIAPTDKLSIGRDSIIENPAYKHTIEINQTV
jgi:hypothetical protein